jgi:hypothetical protein
MFSKSYYADCSLQGQNMISCGGGWIIPHLYVCTLNQVHIRFFPLCFSQANEDNLAIFLYSSLHIF